MTGLRCSVVSIALAFSSVACSSDSSRESGENGGQGGIDPAPGGDDTDGTGGSGSEDDDGSLDVKFDVNNEPGGAGPDPCAEGGECGTCEQIEHTPCDSGTSDLANAIGLNCEGEWSYGVSTSGSEAAIGVRTGFGGTETWAPTEGASFAVLGSGLLADLDLETPAGDDNQQPTHCNDDLGGFDPGNSLPDPLRTNNVAGDCVMDQSLLGSGDCSNTLNGQFSQAAGGLLGSAAQDYTELRVVIPSVPEGQSSLSYDFAFMSTEYPFYFGSEYNDIYVGWLESEDWTGNISFDEAGNPISLNAGFLDFRDDSSTAPELAGTCMKGHAATKWLTTTAPVTAGDSVTLVFAIFDLSDSFLDSYVFLDNFQWGCEVTENPGTVPVG